MQSVVCEVVNRKGMHARAAAKIVSLVVLYDCEVTLTHQGVSAPGDSLLKLLTLNAPKGSKVTVKVLGTDSSILIKKIQQLFSQGFNE